MKRRWNIDRAHAAVPMERRGLAIAIWIACGVCAALSPLAASAQVALAPLLNEKVPSRIPGQYIVVFKPGTTAASMKAIQARIPSLGGKVRHIYTRAPQGFSASLPDDAVRSLREMPEVAYIEVNQVGTLSMVQTSPPTGLDRVSERLLPSAMDNRYTYSETGNNVHVYVIDTGIRASHADFAGRVYGGANTSWTPAEGTGDCNGHGTHVAGTIGGTTYGIAKQALLHPLRAATCGGTTLEWILEAVDWVTDYRILPAVANISSHFPGSSVTVDARVEASIAAGVTYVIAAGNNNVDACGVSPASVPSAITVGGIDPNNDTRAESNFGTCIDMFAPGIGIRSASFTSDTAWELMNGTSMAAPHVAGVAARYLEIHPAASPAAVLAAIHNANNTAATPGWNGVIDRGLGSPNEQLHYGSLNEGVDDGDPHITTVNGMRYDFQPGGEFVALLGGAAVELQTRQSQVPGAPWVSVNTAIAARVGNYRVTWQPGLDGVADPNGLQLRINGALASPSASGIALGVGGRVSQYGSDGIQIDFPDGSTVLATSNWWPARNQWYINVRVYDTPATEGIMGAMEAGEWNRPGFVDSWRVSDETTLFDYREGDSTANYRRDPYPQDRIQPMTPENVELARRVCEPIGDRNLREDCMFDVGTTGDEVFARSAKVGQQLRDGATRTELGANWLNGSGSLTVTAFVGRLSRGGAMPTGSVRIVIDGEQVAGPIALDAAGRANWTTSPNLVANRQVIAEYLPSKDSLFLASTSARLEQPAAVTPLSKRLADPRYRRFSK